MPTQKEHEDYLVTGLVKSCLILAHGGATHEIDRVDENREAMNMIDEAEETEDGVTLVLESGSRFKVTVTRLP